MAGIPVMSAVVQDLLPSINVNSDDYLQRKHGIDFRLKLSTFLRSEDVDPSAYPYAYLVTAPRVFGFSFNPVSFWYLYDNNMVLSAMILEVNNTLGERRIYFLRPDEENKTTSRRVNFSWKKDFHVSPFNYHINTDESYSVSASDIRATRRLDVTIVLRQGKENRPKIVSRAYSEQALDPSVLSFWQMVLFVLRYGWIGYLTEPRILLEARKLWVKSLQVFVWPEPFQGTLSRKATASEVVIEKCFCDLLNEVAQREQTLIIYRASAGSDLKADQYLGCVKNDRDVHRIAVKPLRLHVPSPAFYAELGRTASSLHTVFDRGYFDAKPGEKMLWTSNEKEMRKVVNSCQEIAKGGKQSRLPISGYGRYLALLRSMAGSGVCVTLANPLSQSCSQASYSAFDSCVAKLAKDRAGNSTLPGDYFWAVLNIILADKFALGSEALLGYIKSLLRFTLVVAVTSTVLTLLR